MTDQLVQNGCLGVHGLLAQQPVDTVTQPESVIAWQIALVVKVVF